MGAGDDLPLIHPGWEPGRRLRDRRPRVRMRVMLVMAAAIAVACVPFLFRAGQESPSRQPAFPATAFTTPPVVSPPSPAGPPEWDAGSAQRHPQTVPTPLLPAVPAGSATASKACAIDDLSIVNHGWDSWMPQHRLTLLTATNRGPESCLLGGWPDLRLEQGRPLGLSLQQASESVNHEPAAPTRLLLKPGHSATSMLWWDGYGAAADHATPQRLTVRLGSGERREITLAAGGAAAPFDVLDGATMHVGAWQPSRPTD